MTENYFEYAVEEKPSGKNLLRRFLLITLYIVFALAFFVLFYLLHIPQLIAILPLLMLMLILVTWRYVSVTHEYIISVGEITFVHIYSNRRRKTVLQLPIRELIEVIPDDGEKPAEVGRVLDFRSEVKTPDSYYLTFRDEKDRLCLVYFEATKKALKLMQLYNPGAVKFGKALRY